MPKLSEIEVRPNDILLPDVPDDVIAALALRATLNERSFSEHVICLLADHFDIPRDALASATAIVLDPE
jgi:hypothetical protein